LFIIFHENYLFKENYSEEHLIALYTKHKNCTIIIIGDYVTLSEFLLIDLKQSLRRFVSFFETEVMPDQNMAG